MFVLGSCTLWLMSVAAIADIVFPYRSHLPRDVAVNTLFLLAVDGTSIDDMATSLAVTINRMYNVGSAGATDPLGAYMSNVIDRDLCHVALYDPLLPKGSRPPHTHAFGVAAATDAGDMPLEVALCVTMVGANPTVSGGDDIIIKRRRGRNFIGPFNAVVMGSDGAGGVGRPSSQLQADLVAAYNDLLASQILGAGGQGVAIFSPTAGDATIVGSGWVDNEWDTQRRRGVDPTVRTDLTVGT